MPPRSPQPPFMKLLRRCLFLCLRLFSLSPAALQLLCLLLIPETHFSKPKQKKKSKSESLTSSSPVYIWPIILKSEYNYLCSFSCMELKIHNNRVHIPTLRNIKIKINMKISWCTCIECKWTSQKDRNLLEVCLLAFFPKLCLQNQEVQTVWVHYSEREKSCYSNQELMDCCWLRCFYMGAIFH